MKQEREIKREKEKESERKIRKEEKSRKGIEVWEKERILDIEEYSKKNIDVQDWKGSRQKLRERKGEKENEINENEGEKWVMSWLFKER